MVSLYTYNLFLCIKKWKSWFLQKITKDSKNFNEIIHCLPQHILNDELLLKSFILNYTKKMPKKQKRDFKKNFKNPADIDCMSLNELSKQLKIHRENWDSLDDVIEHIDIAIKMGNFLLGWLEILSSVISIEWTITKKK